MKLNHSCPRFICSTLSYIFLQEAESQLSQLTKQKAALAKQLEESKAIAEDEGRMRSKLQGENRNMQGDLDTMREQLEEEQEGRSDLQRLLTKANNEIQVCKITQFCWVIVHHLWKFVYIRVIYLQRNFDWTTIHFTK